MASRQACQFCACLYQSYAILRCLDPLSHDLTMPLKFVGLPAAGLAVLSWAGATGANIPDNICLGSLSLLMRETMTLLFKSSIANESSTTDQIYLAQGKNAIICPSLSQREVAYTP